MLTTEADLLHIHIYRVTWFVAVGNSGSGVGYSCERQRSQYNSACRVHGLIYNQKKI